MEWGKAKKFILVVLIILNAVLAVLNYRQRQETVMTAAQERAVFEVLSKNGITMYTDLLTDFSPMARLSAEPPAYSKETLERIFFDGERTAVTEAGSKTVYLGKHASLVLEGAWGRLENEGVSLKKGKLTKNEAIRAAETFMGETEHFFGTFDEPAARETEEGFQVEFCGTYKQEKVFSNYFKFLVTKDGIKSIEFMYCPVQGYAGEKRDICYSDEALLAFMREWKKQERQEEATVSRIELGYDVMERNTASDDAVLYLEPCYRIYLMEEEPVLVNAYTAQIVTREP